MNSAHTVKSRTLRITLLDDETLHLFSDQARVLLFALVLLADDHGSVPLYPAWVGAHVWHDTHKRGVERAIHELVTGQRIEPYAVGGTRYGYLIGWHDRASHMYQYIHHPGRARYPERSQDDRSADQWFRDLRRVFTSHPASLTSDAASLGGHPASLGGHPAPSGGHPASLGGHPASSGESFRRARAADLDLDLGSGNTPLPPQAGVELGSLMESYAAGIEAATGTRFVFDRNRGRRLAAVLDAHGPNGESTGAEREAWVRDAAEAFARAADPKYGYSVGRFLAWLNAGRPVSRERPEAPETEAHTMSRPMSEEEKRRLLAEEEAFRAEVAARAGPDRAREIAPPVPLAEAAVLAGADALGSALEGLGASGPTCTADRQPGETEAAYIDRRRTEQLTALAELDLAHEDD